MANYLGNNSLYHNDGNGSFTKVSTEEIAVPRRYSYTGTWGDYDNYGDQDLFFTDGGFFYTGSNFLYQNEGNQNNWISIHCKGTLSNSLTIGAMVYTKATIAGT